MIYRVLTRISVRCSALPIYKSAQKNPHPLLLQYNHPSPDRWTNIPQLTPQNIPQDCRPAIQNCAFSESLVNSNRLKKKTTYVMICHHSNTFHFTGYPAFSHNYWVIVSMIISIVQYRRCSAWFSRRRSAQYPGVVLAMEGVVHHYT